MKNRVIQFDFLYRKTYFLKLQTEIFNVKYILCIIYELFELAILKCLILSAKKFMRDQLDFVHCPFGKEIPIRGKNKPFFWHKSVVAGGAFCFIAPINIFINAFEKLCFYFN